MTSSAVDKKGSMEHESGDLPHGQRCWCGGALDGVIHPLYRRCAACGTACLVRPPGSSDLKSFYSMQGYWHDHQVNVVHFPPIEERAANDFRDRIPVWFNMLRGLKAGVSSVLEIGCAHGGFLSYARDRGVARVVGVEVDAGTCEFARKRFNLPHVESGLFPEVKLPPGKYDAICGFDVVEHFLDPIHAMGAVRDLLEDDGVFLFQTPWFRSQDASWGQFKPSEHIFLYTHSSMRKLMQAAGLELICVLPGYFPDDMFAAGRKRAVKEIVCLRTDSVGDHVMAGAMLPPLAEGFANARLTMVCQEHLKELYETCPQVGNVVTYQKQRAYEDVPYREKLAAQVKAIGADLCLNPVYSREPLGDYLASTSGATYRVGHAGDTCNIDPAAKAQNDGTYSILVPSPQPPQAVPEVRHHADFLRILGIDLADATPRIWTSSADERFADEVFARHGLHPEKTIALFAGAQFPVKDYERFGEALAPLCEKEGFRVVALGTAREADLNQRNLAALAGDPVDLSTQTTIRQSAEILRRCRLAVGTDTGLAHVACAVGTRNVILLGGGHFGRFLPYSPLTTIVCLPLDCYGCNWKCRFTRPHCVRDVAPSVIGEALRLALEGELPEKPRVVAQGRSLWQAPPGGGPNWGWFHSMLDRGSVELLTVGGRRDGKNTVTPIHPPRRHAWPTPPSDLTARRLAAARDCLQAPPHQLAAVFVQWARPILSEDSALPDLPAAVDERMIVDEILSGLARGDDDPWALHYRAAAMLYFRMHELPQWDPQRVPTWIFDDFVSWTVRPPGLFYEIGEPDEYFRRLLAWFERVRTQLKSIPQNEIWRRLAEPMTLLPNLIPAYFTSGEMLPLLRARGDILEMYLRSFGTPLDAKVPPAPDQSAAPGRIAPRMRLGILKNHWLAGTETYATLPLFEHLPRERFEIILYVLQEAHDAAGASCKKKADRFVVLPPDVNNQAVIVRNDRCDVLFYAINMTAVTHGLMPLAVHRLAPVQMTSICSPATSGLPNMDFFLAGELTEPRENAQDGYREKLIKLAGSGICFDYALRPPPSAYTISRQALNLADDAVVLTSGANYYKVIPELRRAWARMLAAAPKETVLMMYPFGPAWTNTYPAGSFLRVFQEELVAAGVDPKRLILLQPMESPTDVRKVMAMTDIYVDSFPYTGATSLLDPLEAGVPPVTMRGDRLRFAQGEALMRELGAAELIASSEDDYIRIVSELARDRDLRERRRQEIREKMAAGPAFLDSKRFGANAAELFERLVREQVR